MIALSPMASELTEQQIDELRRMFKRCREHTVEAIINLRRTADPALIPTIVRGTVWRYLPPEARDLIETAAPETPLASLGMDSLMMLEVVLDVQDAVDVAIDDADLRQVQTIGDFIKLLTQRFTEVHKPA